MMLTFFIKWIIISVCSAPGGRCQKSWKKYPATALKKASTSAEIRVCQPKMISKPPTDSSVAVRIARTSGYGRSFEAITDAVLPRSMNFSMPELTKIIAMRIRPIANMASLTPAPARTSVRDNSRLTVVAVMRSLLCYPAANARAKGAVPGGT